MPLWFLAMHVAKNMPNEKYQPNGGGSSLAWSVALVTDRRAANTDAGMVGPEWRRVNKPML
jgi:hypothetical protein